MVLTEKTSYILLVTLSGVTSNILQAISTKYKLPAYNYIITLMIDMTCVSLV